jgi:hypothetical protein
VDVKLGLPFSLYNRLRMFEGKVLRGIFVGPPKKNEVKAG